MLHAAKRGQVNTERPAASLGQPSVLLYVFLMLHFNIRYVHELLTNVHRHLKMSSTL